MRIKISFPSGLEIEIEDDAQIEPHRIILASKEAEKVTKQLRRSHTDPTPILPMGEHPANFIEAPIGPKEPEPPEPGRNKYGRWPEDIPPETDAEIIRLRAKGLTTRQISTELACQGITMDYKRIRGRLAAIAREQNKRKSKGAALRSTAEIDVKVTEKVEPEVTSDLDARIMEMYMQRTIKEISAELEKEGIDLTPKEISQKVRGIQLRKLGKQAGQTVEQQVPEQVNVAESIPAPTEDPPEKFVTPAKINGAIWDLTKAGLTPKDISEHLQLKGLQWTEAMVEKRLEKIRVGAA